MGLGITILQHLELQLEKLLFEHLNQYANDALPPQSHQSSPAIDYMDISFSDLQITDERALELVGDEENL